MRTFDIIVCSVLKMEGCRNAPVSFAMSVCLVSVNVTTVECNYVCVCVCVGWRYASCVCVCVCSCEYCLKLLSVAKLIQQQ